VVVSDEQRLKSRQWLVIAIIALAVTIVVGGRWWWTSHDNHVVRTHVVDGYTTIVNDQGTALGIASSASQTSGRGYSLLGLQQWRALDGTWHSTDASISGDGAPSCVRPLSSGAHVRAGLIDEPSFGGAPRAQVLVWIECLSEPTSH
jgi:hypothetical protein